MSKPDNIHCPACTQDDDIFNGERHLGSRMDRYYCGHCGTYFEVLKMSKEFGQR